MCSEQAIALSYALITCHIGFGVIKEIKVAYKREWVIKKNKEEHKADVTNDQWIGTKAMVCSHVRIYQIIITVL